MSRFTAAFSFLFLFWMSTASADFRVGDRVVYEKVFTDGSPESGAYFFTALRFDGQQWFFRFEEMMSDGQVFDYGEISQIGQILFLDDPTVAETLMNCEMHQGVRGTFSLSGESLPTCMLSLEGYGQDTATVADFPFWIMEWHYKDAFGSQTGFRMTSFVRGE